jgi:hypothetical protein
MKDRVFRDPVHGLIEFRGTDRRLIDVLETRAVQRLRRIRQMGFAWLVYPGAEHSRFGHALGAFHVARRVCQQLGLGEPVATHVKAAALLHDLGHGPFSHAWEHSFAGGSHESWGRRIVLEDDQLRAVLESIEPDLPRVLTSFWSKEYRPAFACKLVASQLDVDRLDYLLRDGHYSGAGYAAYDLDWILHALRIERIHGGPDPEDLVVDYRRGRHAVEQYLFARAYMYAQVYHHKTVRAAEWMFRKILARFSALVVRGGTSRLLRGAEKLARGEPVAVAEYLRLGDDRVWTAIDTWGDGDAEEPLSGDPVLRDLSNRLRQRRLFKTIDLGDDPGLIARVEPQVAAVARRHFGAEADSYYQFDSARPVAGAPASGDELHVVGHPTRRLLTVGRLGEELPLGRATHTVRLVCAPELGAELAAIAREVL